MARVLILTFTEVARDPRVMRHVAALQGRHHVITCGKGPEPEGVLAHLRIPTSAEHLPLSIQGIVALASRRFSAAYQSLPAAQAAARLIPSVDFDLLIANDITALPVALDVAGTRPVLADLHEYAPREMEEDWRWRLMIQPFAEWLCREYLPRAAAVSTVADGIAAEYRSQFGVDAITITNASQWRDPRVSPVGTPIRAVHSGMATPNRRLEEMIRAAADIDGLTLDLFLVPSPRARRYLKALRRMASQTGNVRVKPPVPMQEVPQTLDGYDLGIYVLAPTSFNNLHALPNKFFDFVQSGLGVVLGPSPEMAALAEEYGLGLVLPDFRQQTLRRALQELQSGTVQNWKLRSCDASWELSSQKEAERLAELVQSLTGSHWP